MEEVLNDKTSEEVLKAVKQQAAMRKQLRQAADTANQQTQCLAEYREVCVALVRKLVSAAEKVDEIMDLASDLDETIISASQALDSLREYEAELAIIKGPHAVRIANER